MKIKIETLRECLSALYYIQAHLGTSPEIEAAIKEVDQALRKKCWF